MQELGEKIGRINEHYEEICSFLITFDAGNSLYVEIVEEITEKAKAWDIFKAKCGKGGKVSSKNLSKKERIDRARKASRSRECVQGKKKGRRTPKKSSI